MSRIEQIGDATLYLGDCLEILPTLPNADLAVTSPPYNIVKTWWGDRHRPGMHQALQAKFTDEWYDDEMPEAGYRSQQRGLIRMLCAMCPVVCYNHKIRYAIKRAGAVYHPYEIVDGYPLWSEVIWSRGGGPAQNCRRPVPADERIYILSSKPPVWNDLGYTSVWNISPNSVETGHPCPFPKAIPQRCIEMFTNAGAVVVDPYCGSGTTGVVCAESGRKFVGIEIEPKYFDIACERIDNAYRQARMFA